MDSIIAILQTHLELIYQNHLCFLNITHQPQTFVCVLSFFPWMNMRCFSLNKKIHHHIFHPSKKRKKTDGGPSAHRVRHVLSETFPLKVLLNLGPLGHVERHETKKGSHVMSHFSDKVVGEQHNWLKQCEKFLLRFGWSLMICGSQLFSFILKVFSITNQPYYCMSLVDYQRTRLCFVGGACLVGHGFREKINKLPQHLTWNRIVYMYMICSRPPYSASLKHLRAVFFMRLMYVLSNPFPNSFLTKKDYMFKSMCTWW